jgi:hypothetical protein
MVFPFVQHHSQEMHFRLGQSLPRFEHDLSPGLSGLHDQHGSVTVGR